MPNAAAKSLTSWKERLAVIVIGTITFLFSVAAIVYFTIMLMKDIAAPVIKKYPFAYSDLQPEDYRKIVDQMEDGLNNACHFNETGHATEDHIVQNVTMTEGHKHRRGEVNIFGNPSLTGLDGRTGLRKVEHMFEDAEIANEHLWEIFFDSPGSLSEIKEEFYGMVMPDSFLTRFQRQAVFGNSSSSNRSCPKVVVKEMKKLKEALRRAMDYIMDEPTKEYMNVFITVDVYLLVMNCLLCAASFLLVAAGRRKEPSYVLPWLIVVGPAIIGAMFYWLIRGALENKLSYFTKGIIIGLIILCFLCLVLLLVMMFFVGFFVLSCFRRHMDEDAPMEITKRTLQKPEISEKTN